MSPAQISNWLEIWEPWQGFLITVGAGLVNAVLCWFGKITSADFVLVTSATVSVYLGSRAYAHAKVNAPTTPSAG